MWDSTDPPEAQTGNHVLMHRVIICFPVFLFYRKYCVPALQLVHVFSSCAVCKGLCVASSIPYLFLPAIWLICMGCVSVETVLFPTLQSIEPLQSRLLSGPKSR